MTDGGPKLQESEKGMLGWGCWGFLTPTYLKAHRHAATE